MEKKNNSGWVNAFELGMKIVSPTGYLAAKAIEKGYDYLNSPSEDDISNEINQYDKRIIFLMENRPQEALMLCDELLSKADSYNEEMQYEAKFFAMLRKSQLTIATNPEEAENFAYEASNWASGAEEKYYAIDAIGAAEMAQEKYAAARDSYIIAMQTSNPSMKDDSHKNYMEATEKFFDAFSESGFCDLVDYPDRQFILIVRDDNHIAGCVDPENIISWTFTQQQYPSDIEFSTGRPVPNTLYVAHPVKTNLYIPFEKSEENIFSSKVNELCFLAQALGATEISIRSIKGMKVDESSDLDWGVEANGEYKGVGVGGGYRQHSKKDSGTTNRKSGERTQVFAPEYSPYIPDDLIWLDTDETWKTMVKQRLQGNLLQHTIKVSSSETTHLSSSMAHDVKASFNTMIAKADAHFDIKNDNSQSTILDTEWEVSINFADKKTLTRQYEITNPIDKDFYFKVEDVFYVESRDLYIGSGKISTGIINTEDKVVIVKKSGTVKKSVVAAVEMFSRLLNEGQAGDDCGIAFKGLQDGDIESGDIILKLSEHAEYNNNDEGTNNPITQEFTFTDGEKQYLDEYKEMIADGEISARDRRYLQTIMDGNGISIERAKELELIAKGGNLTEAEHQYLNEYREMISDGEVSARDRRYLQTIMDANGISIERAKELESMA